MPSELWAALTRKKRIEDNVQKLERVLSLKDLVALGVGSTLGLGAYVLAATIAKHNAGPAVCLSFVFAAISAGISGLCYAEFAARIPKAGSGYVYCYASIGECVAFIIGWNGIFGGILGIASVAKGLSGYVDSLCNSTIKTTMSDLFPMNNNFSAPYPDVLAFGVVTVLTGIFALGVKESSMLLRILSTLNVLALGTAIIAGVTKADFKNWKISTDKIDPKHKSDAGSGGFLPFGIAGMLSGGSRCFYSYSGFQCPADAGGDAKNPKRDIPLAMVISLIFVFFVYSGISAVLTLSTPYYLQDEQAPFAKLFESYGWISLKWVVTLGAVFALSASVMGYIFYVPRIIYAMAHDGLIFKSLATVNRRTKTPLLAITISGIFAAPLATFINLDPLVDVITIQGLLQYIVIAMSVIVLRYKAEEDSQSEKKFIGWFSHIFNIGRSKIATKSTSLVVNYTTLLFTIFTGFLVILLANNLDSVPSYITKGILVILVSVMLMMLLIISRQPQNKEDFYFKIPLVPLIPCLSILLNIYLCSQVSYIHNLILLGWSLLGLLVYLSYGMSHSEENPTCKNKIVGEGNTDLSYIHKK